jgi:hypothetical protein
MEISQSTSKGNLVISDEAVSSIVINAAKDVAGVIGFSNTTAGRCYNHKKRQFKGYEPRSRSARTAMTLISVFISLLKAERKFSLLQKKFRRLLKNPFRI